MEAGRRGKVRTAVKVWKEDGEDEGREGREDRGRGKRKREKREEMKRDMKDVKGGKKTIGVKNERREKIEVKEDYEK